MARRIKTVFSLTSWTFLLSILVLGLGIFLSPWLPLSFVPWLQVLSPLLVGLSVLYTIGLIISLFQARWFWAGLCALFLGLSCLVISQNIRSDQPALVETPEQLKVLSYNLGAFRLTSQKVGKVIKLIQELDPDIIAFQEFRNVQVGESKEAISYFSDQLDLPYYHFLHLHSHIHGIAVFSRYPILANDTLYLPEEEVNSGMMTTIQTPQGPINIANLHMSSFQFVTVMRSADGRLNKTKAFFRQIKRVLWRQEAKFDKVFAAIDASPYPVILAGDFNAPSHSRLSRMYRGRLSDAFLTKGVGGGWTFPMKRRGGNWGMRLDYLYYSPEVEALRCERFPRAISDHFPLLGTFRLKAEPSP
ncbi:MAG: endonuclease/exonuclease/phosphatase family protein [Bacteroidia bacterium]